MTRRQPASARAGSWTIEDVVIQSDDPFTDIKSLAVLHIPFPRKAPTADKWEKGLTTAGAIATLITTLAGAFSSSFKPFGWCLFAIGTLLLVGIAVARLNGAISQKRVLVPTVFGIFLISVVAVVLAGWGVAHPSTPGSQAPKTEQAPITYNSYTSTTSGSGSPIINGNGGTYNANSHTDKPAPKDMRR